MIIRKDDLEAAVEHGIISARAAKALSEFTLKRANVPRAANEPFRIVNNFAEVFICIGLFIIFFAASTLLFMFGLNFLPLMILVFWAFSEYFTFHTIKTAPAIISVGLLAYLLVEAIFHFTGNTAANQSYFSQSTTSLFYVALAWAAVLGVVFARFRLPILLLPLVAAITISISLTLSLDTEDAKFLIPLGVCGLITLAVATWLDSRDPLRRSKTNAYAFWLFIIGSPLTIHPLLVGIFVSMPDNSETIIAIIVLAIAVLATLTGLLLDRRSLVASSLIYFTLSIGWLSSQIGAGVTMAVTTTSLTIGLGVVLLGVFWYRIRAVVLQLLPLPGLKAKLPPGL